MPHDKRDQKKGGDLHRPDQGPGMAGASGGGEASRRDVELGSDRHETHAGRRPEEHRERGTLGDAGEDREGRR